ncbi:hypothetical protein BC829DRAFT_450138 [Chytridium lagenaria]|nr:hypothetical protein BC829DRAFT_450138 [Chytridium lagenaria]
MPLITSPFFLLILILIPITTLAQSLSTRYTDPQLRALTWFPALGSGTCSDLYRIPSQVKSGVIASSGAVLERPRPRYANQVGCTWTVRAETGSVIKLDFIHVDTECGWDFVKVYDGPSNESPELAHLCGNRSPTFNYTDVFASSSSSVTINFMSDSEYTATGFAAVFTVLPTTNFAPFTGREFHSTAYDTISDGTYSITKPLPVIDLFVHDFATGNWSRPSTNLWGSKAPSARYSHASWFINGRLYLIGGQSFGSTASVLWVYDPDQNSWTQRFTLGQIPSIGEGTSYVLAQTSNSTKIFAVGGYLPFSFSFQISRNVFSLDLDTLTWSRHPDCPVPTWGMTGVYHSATNSIYFTGGYRWTALTTTPVLNTLSPPPSGTPTGEPVFRGRSADTGSACGNWTYVKNCLAKSYCNFCNDTCELNRTVIPLPFLTQQPIQSNASLTLPGTCLSKPTSGNVSSVCPAVIPIEISKTMNFVVGGMSQNDHIAFIDLPEYDLMFTLQQLNQTTLPLTLTLTSIRQRPSTNTSLTLLSRDSRRYVGPYYLRITNPSLLPLSYTLLISPTQSPFYPDLPTLFRNDNLDVTTFVTIFILSLFVCLSMTYLIKRARDQVAMARALETGGDAGVVMKEPPTLFRALLEFQVRERKVSAATVGSDDGKLGKKSTEKSVQILRSRYADDIALSTLNSRTPLSAEHLASTDPSRRVIAINHLIVFPGFEATLTRGELPQLAVATQLADCSRQRFPEPPLLPSGVEVEDETRTGHWMIRWIRDRGGGVGVVGEGQAGMHRREQPSVGPGIAAVGG